MVPWSKAFMSYRGGECANGILKSFYNVQPSSSTSSSSKIPSPSWKLIHLLIIFVMNVRKCSLLWAALHLREEIMTAGENSPSPLLYFKPTIVFAKSYHFCFIITFTLYIFCVTRNNLLLFVVTLSPYIVVTSYFVTLTSSLVPISHIVSSYPIH